MLRMRLEADLTLGEPSEHVGLVVPWLARVERYDDPEGPPEVIGTVRARVIHYGEALNLGVMLDDALDDALDGALATLHEAFFTEQGVLREAFEDADGEGLLYVESIDLADEWRAKRLDVAAVRRLADTLGMGCSLVVLHGDEMRRLASWRALGFVTVNGGPESFLALNQSHRAPRVRETAALDTFEVIPPAEVSAEVARPGRN